jgi:hypothetical protein
VYIPVLAVGFDPADRCIPLRRLLRRKWRPLQGCRRRSSDKIVLFHDALHADDKISLRRVAATGIILAPANPKFATVAARLLRCDPMGARVFA